MKKYFWKNHPNTQRTSDISAQTKGFFVWLLKDATHFLYPMTWSLTNSTTRMPDFAIKVSYWLQMWQIRHIFFFTDFSIFRLNETKCTEIWSEKFPYLSNLVYLIHFWQIRHPCSNISGDIELPLSFQWCQLIILIFVIYLHNIK